MDGISILMESAAFGASYAKDVDILTESTKSEKVDPSVKISEALKDSTGLSSLIFKLDVELSKEAKEKLNKKEAKLIERSDKLDAAVTAKKLKGHIDIIQTNANLVEKELKAALKKEGADVEKIKTQLSQLNLIKDRISKAKASYSKLEQVARFIKTQADNMKKKYSEMGAVAKVAESVFTVVAAYSIGYGILKTIDGINAGSFLSVTTNISKMISVAVNPNKYGWAKSGAIVLLALLAGYGIYRFGSAVVKAVISKFSKGEAAPAE